MDNSSQKLFSLETQLSNPQLSLSEINSIHNQILSLKSNADSSIAQKLFEDRRSQLILDCEMLIKTYKIEENEPIAQHNAYKYTNYNDTNMLFDETLEMTSDAQNALFKQTQMLKNVHQRVLDIAAKVEIGGQTISQILRIEQVGGFVRALAIVIIIIIWLCIKIFL